jgi:C-terminal processing protease CtpA/Prc
VRDNLKEAMEVTIDPDGNGINFKLPAKDANGNYITPLTYDGISRRFALSSGSLILTVNGNSTTILTNVVTKDHRGDGSSPTYQIFTPGTGSIIRIVTVQLVTDRVIQNGQHAYGRVREQILLRNTPQIIQ